VEKATVAVWDATPRTFESMASAFLVKGRPKGKRFLGLFLTSAHVLSKCRNSTSPCEFHVYHHYQVTLTSGMLASPQDGDSWEATISHIAGFDVSNDLAAFTAEFAKATEPVQFRSWQRLEGIEEIIVLGNPDLAIRKHWHIPIPDPLRQTYWSQGTVFLRQPYRDKKTGVTYDMLFHTADTLPGNSGGPLVDSHGYVIGINTRYGGNRHYDYVDQSHSFAVPADTIQAFLAKVKF